MKNNKINNLHYTLVKTGRNRNNIILVALLSLIIFTISIMWPFAFSFKLGIIAQEGRFKSEQFHKISETGITDNKGTITFIDTDLNVLYPEDSNLNITQEQLDNMLDVEMVSQAIKTFSYTKNNIDYKQIYSEGETTRTSWYLLIDDNNNYIESENFHHIKAVYSDEDIDYIENDYVKDARDYKYLFVSERNNEYYMIVELDQRIVLFEPYEIGIIIASSLMIITLISILVKTPTRKLIKQLNQPIKDLSDAMINFSPGKRTRIENVYGIMEYDSIINTFNDMVIHINELEDQNTILEKNKKNMFAAITHDLKTPITVLNGYVNAMINGKISQEDYEKYYKKILMKSEQLNTLINEFATYNEMNHSKYELRKQLIDVNKFIRDYFATNFEYIDDNDFKLLIDIPETKVEYYIDKLQFTRALDNLLSNFIKYNPKKTTIHIDITSTIDSISIVIENNGHRINDKISTTLFDPFIIDDQSRNTTSTGLGLSITKRIIELHNGKIIYKSNDDYCNRFVIILNR